MSTRFHWDASRLPPALRADWRQIVALCPGLLPSGRRTIYPFALGCAPAWGVAIRKTTTSLIQCRWRQPP